MTWFMLLAKSVHDGQPGDSQDLQCKNLNTTNRWLENYRHIAHHPLGMG